MLQTHPPPSSKRTNQPPPPGAFLFLHLNKDIVPSECGFVGRHPYQDSAEHLLVICHRHCNNTQVGTLQYPYPAHECLPANTLRIIHSIASHTGANEAVDEPTVSANFIVSELKFTRKHPSLTYKRHAKFTSAALSPPTNAKLTPAAKTVFEASPPSELLDVDNVGASLASSTPEGSQVLPCSPTTQCPGPPFRSAATHGNTALHAKAKATQPLRAVITWHSTSTPRQGLMCTILDPVCRKQGG